MPLTPDELARIEAGCEEEVEQIGDDVDEVAEALAVHSIISEERHDEILERVEICQSRLEVLSTQVQAISPSSAENPTLARILEQLGELKGRVESLQSLQSSMDLKPIVLIPPESIPSPPPSAEEENPDQKTESPEAEELPPAPKKKRFRVL